MGGSKLQVGPFKFGEYFRGIETFLTSSKTKVATAQLSTDSSIAERAFVLRNFLATEFPGQKVNIIAHSLGGLDARYLASIAKDEHIASITTIATPHHGTPLADWAYDQMKNKKFWYRFFLLFGYNLEGRRFLPELTVESMEKKFNPLVRDRKDIKYFSVRTYASTAEGNLSYMLWFPGKWLESMDKGAAAAKHDGLVPLESQGWGEVIATLPMDHLAQMNHHEFRRDMEKESMALYTLIYDRLVKAGL